MQNFPSMEQLMQGNQQQQAQPQAQAQPQIPMEAPQGDPRQDAKGQKALMIIVMIREQLKKTGYFEENKDRMGEVNQEIMDLAQALLDEDEAAAKASPLYEYLVSKKGQLVNQNEMPMSAPTPQDEPNMEAMTANEAK